MRKSLARTVILDFIKSPWKYNNGKMGLMYWAKRILGHDGYTDLITAHNVRRRNNDPNLSAGEKLCV